MYNTAVYYIEIYILLITKAWRNSKLKYSYIVLRWYTFSLT